jgi:NADH-quinone oxidoreductase subunit C/D
MSKLLDFFEKRDIYEEGNRLYMSTSLLGLKDDIRILKDEFKFIFLSDIIGTEKSGQFEIIYHLTNLEFRKKFFLNLRISKTNTLPSLSMYWPLSVYHEMELWDMLGVNVEEGLKKRILNIPEFHGHPLSENFVAAGDPDESVFCDELPEIHQSVIDSERREGLEWSSHGPCSNNIKRPVQLQVKTDNDIVLDCRPKIGHVHRGVEKLASELDYFQFNIHADRINYQSCCTGSIVWCMTIEQLINMEISDRSKALRMVFLELGRIADHFTCLANICSKISYEEAYWENLKLRDEIQLLFNLYNGRENVSMPARIGGMSKQLPYGWSAQCMETIKNVKSKLFLMENELLRSRLWMDALQVCDITSTDAISSGVSGPVLRACGINFDLRKDMPYYFYEEVDFEIPLGVRGDVHDRYLVRFEEIKQSLNIVTQVMDNLPISKKEDQEYDPGFWFSLEEEAMDASVYCPVESSNGEFGFYLEAATNKRARRVKVRGPSFSHVFALKHIMYGSYLKELPLAMESLNIIPTEHDR